MANDGIIAAAVGIGIVALFVLGSHHQQHPPSPTTRLPKPTPAPSLPSTTPTITPVSETQPVRDFGVCQCVGDTLTGQQCKLAGKSCSDVRKRMQAENCICGADGIATGLNCPFIGQSCL